MKSTMIVCFAAKTGREPAGFFFLGEADNSSEE